MEKAGEYIYNPTNTEGTGGVYRGLRVDSKSTEVDFYESIGMKTNPAEVYNIITEGQEGIVETLEGNRVGDCAKEGENEACGANLSAEPKPPYRRLEGKALADWCRWSGYSCTDCAWRCENNQTSGYNSTPEDKRGPCSEPDDQVFIQDQEIETQWQRIETSLAILRNLYIERANEEFLRREKSLMEGMR